MLQFSKYQGTGNDFILIDDREPCGIRRKDHDRIAQLCDRRFGIGADGLMLLRNHPDFDFEMVYFNADGHESSMCGNGGRCITAFAQKIGAISGTSCTFLAIDGPHEAAILPNGEVSLKMKDVHSEEIKETDEIGFTLNTGSPHYVKMVAELVEVDIVADGRRIRNSREYKSEGINVNFFALTDEGMSVLTYERGVEDETYSCGTGVVACAIVMYHIAGDLDDVAVQTKGGNLRVTFGFVEGVFQNIRLIGPATHVFSGEIDA